MIGKSGNSVGTLHSIPAPSASVLNQALSLLATFGDSKGLKATLASMAEVQEKNEAILKQAQEEIALLASEREKFSREVSEFSAKKAGDELLLNRRAAALSQDEAKLRGLTTQFVDEKRAQNESMTHREQEVAYKENALAERDKKLNEKENRLDVLEKELSARHVALVELQASIQAREAKLRSFLNG